MLAAEKIGAAAVISTERNATVLQVQAERIRADAALQAERIRAEMDTRAERYNIANTLALSDMRLEQQKQACEIERRIAEICCCVKDATATTNALIASIEANRVRDELSRLQTELLIRNNSRGGNGNGNSGS